MKKLDILENQVNNVYLSLGSNLGKKIKNLEHAKSLLDSFNIKILKSSSFYRSKSWPNKNFPEYLNLVLLIKTNLNLLDLFQKIKIIEKLIGRTNAKKNYPRICDIDIIDYNGICKISSLSRNKVIVPHERMHSRNFVLMPLYEINKNWIHPKYKKNIVKLISSLPINDLRSIKVN